MTIGGASAWGLRSLADNLLRYFQPSLPCYLRIQNVDSADKDYAKLGFTPNVTGAQPGQSGIFDILVDPPPETWDNNSRDIGITGGRLQNGTRKFMVSHTFVVNQMQTRNLTDPYLVWRDPSVMGLYYNNRLFAITEITHEDLGGEILDWSLTGTAAEFPSTT